MYRWEQHYGIDRFDLSGPKAFPVGGLGWITRCADDPNTVSMCTVTREQFAGYITAMCVTDPPGATFHWRIWWDTRDERGKDLIHSDQVLYPTRKVAMRALEQRFGISVDDVRETRWEGNFSAYMDEP